MPSRPFCPHNFEKELWDAGTDVEYQIAFEPELGGENDALNYTTMGWGYWSYPHIPLVDRFRYITGGKFTTNICDRWNHAKTDMGHMAWFNDDGVETWENVWGSWNGITPYDGEQIRRVAKKLRYFGAEGYLQSPDWEPHITDVIQNSVYASRWPLRRENSTLWTLVH